ncbi:MAG TPA: phosphoenolpyruvate--protein phosphotransferase [Candidatus Kapabacteria bacterium]|nr:phosphoenolpyruvate--protein phosphotransferase [Candidatus Kapabacteria bacterium]
MDNNFINSSDSDTNHSKGSGILKGIPASNGIVVGKCFVVDDVINIIANELISDEEVGNEITRLEEVYRLIRAEFDEAYHKVQTVSNSVRAIIESNLFIVNDVYIEKEIVNIIKDRHSAESSVIQVFEKQKTFFKKSKDPILRERSVELDHIKQRLISKLKQQEIVYSNAKNKILIVVNVTPNDLLHFVEAGIIGMVTEVGGIASHVSIMARAYGLPAVIGVKDAANLISNGDNAIVDAYAGSVYYNPNYTLLKSYKIKIEKIRERRERLGKLIDIESMTKDNRRVIVSANADKYEEVMEAIINGAENIGLMRSEMMIISLGKIPDEKTQYEYYHKLAQAVYPKKITIRVFDIGSDKYSEGIPLSENNPALGFRGIRYLLASEDLYKAQLRAILRASSMKNIKILLPMICSISEVEDTKRIIDSIKQELISQDIPFDNNIAVGVMIETPAAVIMLAELCKYVDFFSIGTNDLTQYTLATDRDNSLVTNYYDTFHPSVIRQIKYVSEIANKAGIPISVCGELAGHSAATELLIGLGVNELSVAPSLCLEIKSKILSSNYAKLKRIMTKLIKLPDSTSILSVLEKDK